MAERGHSGEGPSPLSKAWSAWEASRQSAPSSAVPGPQGIPPEAVDAAAKAIHSMALRDNSVLGLAPNTTREDFARAAIEAALPFLSGTPKGLELSDEEVKALSMASIFGGPPESLGDTSEDMAVLTSARAKLRDELARRSGSPEGGTA